jgi:hypothetical protein
MCSTLEWMCAKDTCPREWKSTFMKFTVHTAATAPAEAGEHLRATEKAFGFVPNLLGVLAEFPVALLAYIDLTEIEPVDQHELSLSIFRNRKRSRKNDCCSATCLGLNSGAQLQQAPGMPDLP